MSAISLGAAASDQRPRLIAEALFEDAEVYALLDAACQSGDYFDAGRVWLTITGGGAALTEQIAFIYES